MQTHSRATQYCIPSISAHRIAHRTCKNKKGEEQRTDSRLVPALATNIALHSLSSSPYSSSSYSSSLPPSLSFSLLWTYSHHSLLKVYNQHSSRLHPATSILPSPLFPVSPSLPHFTHHIHPNIISATSIRRVYKNTERHTQEPKTLSTRTPWQRPSTLSSPNNHSRHKVYMHPHNWVPD